MHAAGQAWSPKPEAWSPKSKQFLADRV